VYRRKYFGKLDFRVVRKNLSVYGVAEALTVREGG
jgi:hypothetical protein